MEDEELLFEVGGQFDNELFEYEESVLPKLSITKTLNRNEIEFERTIDLSTGISMIVGVTIGSGIFSSPGPVLLQSQSIGASLAIWLLAGFLSSTGSLSYAELGTMISESGGDHPYLLRAFGEFPAFLFSWTNLLASRPGSLAIILSVCSEYLCRIFLSACNTLVSKSITVFIILALTFLNAKSTKSSSYAQNIMTVLKLLSLLLISGLGMSYLFDDNVNFRGSIFNGSSTNPGNYALAIYSALWAYDGWNALNTITGNPNPNPRGIERSISKLT
jgi:amino acid transporter